MESNIAGYPNYHVTKIGDVYRIGKINHYIKG